MPTGKAYAEELTAKELIARNTHTIASEEARGIHWNRTKCKEHYGNPPEAVIGQATINLDSQVLKSLEDSLPELYCVDFAEAYVMQENLSSWLMCRNKRERLICDCPMDVCTRNLWQRAKMGKETGTESTTRVPQTSHS
jgi:hypothetical protein